MDIDASLNILSAIDDSTGAFIPADPSLGPPLLAQTERTEDFPGIKTYLDNEKGLHAREVITELVSNTNAHLAEHGEITTTWNKVYDMLVHGYEDKNGDW